ncbi:MAG TPA: hypothetical protein VIM28_04525 [Solirubrobacterales bacterium]
MANTDRPTRDILIDAIRENPGITRAEMLAATGLPSGAIDPARLRLWKAGRIEPDSEGGWEDALNHRIKNVGWRCVDDPSRQVVVQERTAERTERNAEPTAEEQAILIVEALKDPVVNKLVLEMTNEGTGSRRSQKRAAQALKAQEMARKREAEEAARGKAANANFKRNLAQLWEARGAVGAIDQYLVEERAQVAQGAPRRISDLDWLLALNDVRSIIKSFGPMWQNLRDIGGRNEPCPACGAVPIQPTRALGAFKVESDVIDVTAIEEDVIENEDVET